MAKSETDQEIEDLRNKVQRQADALHKALTERDELRVANEKLQQVINGKWSGIDQLMCLRDEVDSIIFGLKPTDFQGAINWGDLGCAEIERILTEDDRTFIRIVIEEASEGETQLINAVRDGLIANGRDVSGLEIVTQW